MEPRVARDLDATAGRQQPAYPNLLDEGEAARLRPVLEAVVRRRQEVVSQWYQRYARYFGDSRSLSNSEFVDLFVSALYRILDPLMEGNREQFAHQTIRLGELLIQRRMPSAEAFACLALFQESARFVFPVNPPLYAIHGALEHLNLELASLIMAAYFSSHAAVAGERLAAEDRVQSRLPASGRRCFHGLVGSNPSMRELYRNIEVVGQSRGTVLIRGETGTRKSIIARAVHQCSARAREPFVLLNCGMLPRDLIEGELFGWPDRGGEYLGILRAAHGGTVFLNEITEIGLETQSRLLRAIRCGTLRPVGSQREHPLDARIIAATSRDPVQAVISHRLNPKLLECLSASTLEIPPLRDRSDDIPSLVDHFIAFFNRRFDRAVVGISHDAIRAMMRYSWPGNERELAATVEEACIFTDSALIGLENLPPPIGEPIFFRRAASVQSG